MSCEDLRGVVAVYIKNIKVRISDDDILVTTMKENRNLLSSGIITSVTGSYSITLPKVWLPDGFRHEALLDCSGYPVVVEMVNGVISQSNSILYGDFSNNYNTTDGSFNNLSFSSKFQKFEYID